MHFYTTERIKFPKEHVLHNFTKCLSDAGANQIVNKHLNG